MNIAVENEGIEVILGNSNPRFSGVTSTMLQTLEVQAKLMNVCVLGKHHLPEHLQHLSINFLELAKICRASPANGKLRVFHARRNDEMLQALILKHLFRAQIKIVFTSTAQRYHSKFTRWLMNKMDCVISTCEAAASYLKEKPTAIIPHGIQSETYLPNPIKRGADTTTIAMFGRVREQKGTHFLLTLVLKCCPKNQKSRP